MKAAGGHHNVIQLLGMWRVGGDVIMAMPHINHCKFIDLVASISLEEVKFYIANLLSALAHIHKLGIIHRDIKPSNFLYDRENKKFALVDFGLAQFDKEISGVKRKIDEDQSQSESCSKKPRIPLHEADSKLNRKSPRTRLLKDSTIVRRSPRKLSLGMSPILVENLDSVGPLGVSLNSPAGLYSGLESQKKTLTMKTPTKTPPVRCSPRKNLAQMNKPITAVKITNNSIISPDMSTPSPSTMTRRPSFTTLDVSGQSQLTEFSGVTGLLRASVTSHCSSALRPRPESSRVGGGVSCSCPGKMTVCSSCLSLPHLHAPRAGTPGFRPPEVLLKSNSQSVAVDMWAVGVILLSLLSRSYPFFRSPDDMTALAEIISLFGSNEVQAAAKRYKRRVTLSLDLPQPDLAQVCKSLGARALPGDSPPPCIVTSQGVDLLKKFLCLDQSKRVTAVQALKHSYLRGIPH